MIFLSFSNSETSPLPSLSREYEQVSTILAKGYLSNRFQLFTDPIATPQRLVRQLKQFRGHLRVFLFSGHAGRDGLLLQGDMALAEGLALELKQTLDTLKLVILNGCSTGGQVSRLLELGVPVVIATSAPVGDQGATEFSIRFFENLAEQKSIRDAFRDALGPAKMVQADIRETEAEVRGLSSQLNATRETPLWGLFYGEGFAKLLDTNPLYMDAAPTTTAYASNQLLVDTLCDKTLAAHPNMLALQVRADAGELIEQSDREIAIVNALPFPVGEHLRKLFCLVEGDGLGFDKASPQRLAQMGLCYHIAVELLGFLVLAQLWDLLLDRNTLEPPEALRAQLRQYFDLSSDQRRIYRYFDLIRQIHQFFETLDEAPYFVEELRELGKLLEAEHPFAQACHYLQVLHERGEKAATDSTDIGGICLQAEENLARFFGELPFLGKYMLVSVQDIDVQKYRHSRAPVFSHELVRLMRAMGKTETSHFLLDRFMDNRGLLFVKGQLRAVKPKPGQAPGRSEFQADNLQYLNISPFLIDRNAFERNADLTHLFSFDAYIPGSGEYWFRSVKKPNEQQFVLGQQPEFEAIRAQFDAFRQRVLGETLNP